MYEQGSRPGGAARSAPVLGEGTIVDMGAAAHPFGIASPVFKDLDLQAHGLEWAHSRYAMAHPLDDGRAAFLSRGLDTTATQLGEDASRWRQVHGLVTRGLDKHLENVLGPVLRFPPHPVRSPCCPHAPWPAPPSRRRRPGCCSPGPRSMPLPRRRSP